MSKQFALKHIFCTTTHYLVTVMITSMIHLTKSINKLRDALTGGEQDERDGEWELERLLLG